MDAANIRAQYATSDKRRISVKTKDIIEGKPRHCFISGPVSAAWRWCSAPLSVQTVRRTASGKADEATAVTTRRTKPVRSTQRGAWDDPRGSSASPPSRPRPNILSWWWSTTMTWWVYEKKKDIWLLMMRRSDLCWCCLWSQRNLAATFKELNWKQ